MPRMAKVKHPAFKYIKSAGGIHEYSHKKNGLSVLLREEHSTPTATLNVTYRVGSRDEAIGYTGATHILEHLMFKGSKNFNRQKGNPIWKVIEGKGARLNATTWLDRTNYYELVPAEHLNNAIALEADRMRGAFLCEEDRQSEMTVVRNEFERGENDPMEALDKELWAAAYLAHPYHHSTIGWRSDIEKVPIERLRKFYDDFYHPNNATAVVIGDFDTKEILSRIDKTFGRIRASKNPIPEMYTEEPRQEGPRRVVVKRSGETGLVGVAHKMPKALDSDTHAFAVLVRVLADGRSSRLEKALVDRGLCTNFMTYASPMRDPGLCTTYALLNPKVKHEQVEEIILNEYARVAAKGITEAELDRAKKRVETETAMARDGSFSQAAALNEAIAVGDWTFYTNFLSKVKKVSAADVKRVAAKYLVEDQSVIGYFIPKVKTKSPGL